MTRLQGGSETSNVVWLGYGGTDQKTGSRIGSGRVQNDEMLFESDEDGQDEKRAHQRDSKGRTV